MKKLQNFFFVFLLISAGCGDNNTANTEGVRTADSVSVQDNTKTEDFKIDTSRILVNDTPGNILPLQQEK